MKKQTGLAVEDIVAIVADDYRSLTLSVGIPGHEQYAVTKQYSDKQDYLANIEQDIRDYQQSLARTTFMVDEANSEDLAVVNDSWGAIWKDAKTEVKSKFFARN
jgi:hypothetical protein